MKCYLANGQGVDSIQLIERPSPKIENDRDVLVQVNACSLNYRDLMVAKGLYQSIPYGSKPFIPLSDMSGVVLEVGKQVTEYKPGDRVLNSPFRNWPAGTLKDSWAKTFIGTIGADGVLAEQIVYPADSLVKVPAHLSFQEASTFTIAGLTAWSAVVVHGKTRPGEWVLLHGTGGVSIFSAQLAKALGAKILMTTSSKEKADFVKSRFGVHATVNYQDMDWPEQVMRLTSNSGVDVVVEVVGGMSLASSLKVCNYGARVSVVGILSGTESTIQIRHLLRRQIEMRGIFMESSEELQRFMNAVEALNLRSHVDKVFSFEQAKEAYKYLEGQHHIGKVVINVEASRSI